MRHITRVSPPHTDTNPPRMASKNPTHTMTSPDNSVDVSVEEGEIDHPSSEPGATRTDNAVFMQGNDSVAEVAMAATTSTSGGMQNETLLQVKEL